MRAIIFVCVCFPSDVYVMDCVCVSGPHFLCVCDNHWLSVVLYAGKSPLALIYYLHFPTACNFLQTDVETDRQTDRQTDGSIAARIDSAFIQFTHPCPSGNSYEWTHWILRNTTHRQGIEDEELPFKYTVLMCIEGNINLVFQMKK